MKTLACKNCRARKVRCDKAYPCSLCLNSGLACRYNASEPRIKPHRGPGARILTQLRRDSKSPEHSWPSNNQSRYDCRIPEELIKRCIAYFFDEIYPNMPIISPSIQQITFSHMAADTELYSLVAALCALTLLQPSTIPWPDKNALQQGQYCLSEAERSRTLYNHIESATVNSVVTSYLVHSCYYALHMDKSSWFYLREAITLAQENSMDQENSYDNMESEQKELRRRVFWLLFITERAHGLLRWRSIILKASIRLPTTDNVYISYGFVSLIKLYGNVDQNVVESWTNHRLPIKESFLVDLSSRLSKYTLQSSPTTSSQLADLIVTQRWLQIIAWQLGLSRKILSSRASSEAMGLIYPIQIARNLLCDVAAIPQASIEVHGEDLVEKIFDVACTVTDILNCCSIMDASLKSSAKAYLVHLGQLVSSIHSGHSKFKPLLLEKLQSSDGMLTASPLLLACSTDLTARERKPSDYQHQQDQEPSKLVLLEE